MERRLESINLKYWFINENEEIKIIPQVMVTYRTIVNNVPQKVDTIVITEDMDYTIYEEKIQKICQIAFEGL
jgi:hypothetical protein